MTQQMLSIIFLAILYWYFYFVLLILIVIYIIYFQIILLSCLLHLTVTPFFFIVELAGRCQISFIVLQVLWFLAHFFQLILVVEPCNVCLQEVTNRFFVSFICINDAVSDKKHERHCLSFINIVIRSQ